MVAEQATLRDLASRLGHWSRLAQAVICAQVTPSHCQDDSCNEPQLHRRLPFAQAALGRAGSGAPAGNCRLQRNGKMVMRPLMW
jgi:hypothetical protein